MKFKDFKKGMIVKWVEQLTKKTIYAKIIDVNSEEAEYLVLNRTTYISSFNKLGFEKGYYVEITSVNYKDYKKVTQELHKKIKECNSLIKQLTKEHTAKIKNIEGDINQYTTCVNDLNQK